MRAEAPLSGDIMVKTDYLSGHKIYVTENSEYHLCEETCIAVRDLETHKWLQKHVALGQKIVGGIARSIKGGLVPHLGNPNVGEQVCFSENVLTSCLQDIRKPSPTTVDSYPAFVFH